jgi:hypothetical protein
MDKNSITDISSYLTKVIKWRKINDIIRTESSLDFWYMSKVARHVLNWQIEECENLVKLIRTTEVFSLPIFDPAFSEIHSAGVVNYKDEDFFWGIRYHPQDRVVIGYEKDPFLLDSDNYKTTGWIELLDEYLKKDEEVDISF